MGLIERIQEEKDPKWKAIHNNKDFYEAYKDVCDKMAPFLKETARGAFQKEIENYIQDLIEKIKNGEITSVSQIEELLINTPLLFLNDHGEDHVAYVIKKADEILAKFDRKPITNYESFILLCAIQIHDIGNILGREKHEQKLNLIFDEAIKGTLVDTAERRIIKSIAMAHGGKTQSGSRNTISELMPLETFFAEDIRTRELAAVLRLADELADDLTRYSYGASFLHIIGDFSGIKHDYSRVLHTVSIKKMEDGCCQICLVYEMSTEDIKKKYIILGKERFLLDEIYDRTLKMERERRYCQKFLNANIMISRIQVEINIYGNNCKRLDRISYPLEDVSYPSDPADGSIKQVSPDIKTGSEEYDYILKREAIK